VELSGSNRVVSPNVGPQYLVIGATAVLGWFKSDRQHEIIRGDRKRLEARARRLLECYLFADGPSKKAIYELVAGAAAGCQPGVSDPKLDSVQLAQASAELAINVIRLREDQAIADEDQLSKFDH
jgi:hypothetical protein